MAVLLFCSKGIPSHTHRTVCQGWPLPWVAPQRAQQVLIEQNPRTPAGLPTTRFSGTIAQARINTPCSQRLVVVGDAYRRNARVGLLFSETPYEQQLAASVPRAPSLARFAPGADRAAASCRRRRSRAVDSVPLPAPKQPRSSHPRCGLWFSKRRLR